eukprot:CAMPEP_0194411284 /NCGR_PEP_ID=MMETSP0176-20130528/9413_1 /TAXON_ID=216777 /ORGANISM="Proboscia alata, Strain PI-D3" /LENGTH=88 /DNA_ID=CAMNT_0039213135 /DNA_START=411 /DNA_END=678 /DNA_ORIENTATION=-
MTASKSNEYKRLFSPRSRNPRCLPELKDPSISKFGLVVNGDTPASQRWILLMIQFFSTDPMGHVESDFGVGYGWKPDDEELSPYLKTV